MPEHWMMPPTQYEIWISGYLDPERAEWFGDMALTVRHATDGCAITVLSGPVADRAALFGILNRIRDLGLRLIAVNPIASDRRNPPCDGRQQADSACQS